MKTATFILPFDPITKITSCPAPEWVHKTLEKEHSVVAQVRGEDVIIDAMKADQTYQWLEDQEVPIA